MIIKELDEELEILMIRWSVDVETLAGAICVDCELVQLWVDGEKQIGKRNNKLIGRVFLNLQEVYSLSCQIEDLECDPYCEPEDQNPNPIAKRCIEDVYKQSSPEMKALLDRFYEEMAWDKPYTFGVAA